MATGHREQLKAIRTFPSLVKYLRDELDWPITTDDFDDATFDYTPEELGIDSANAAKIQEIKRLRPLTANQPWGIFFVKFEPKRLPVVALRRILSSVVVKKRASANSAERAAWETDDLLFISNYGEGDQRQISFAHFSQDGQKGELPTLKVLGWDSLDTPLHMDHIADVLHEHLVWPDNPEDAEGWRDDWRAAFSLRHREVITTSKTLAIRLAALARAIRDRIRTVLDIETEKGALTKLMAVFREALIHDLDRDGFADMYAQTIAYGILSARITNPKDRGARIGLPTTSPFLKELMATFLGGKTTKHGSDFGVDFDELGVSEVVDLLDEANIDAVVRDFGDRNPQEDPVTHFYEDFLDIYDGEKRKRRGVYYTPLPVVSFMVRSVDEVLRNDFGLEDGLASTSTWSQMLEQHEGLEMPKGANPDDPFVQILDPATGTGTFLAEAIDLIHNTMVRRWREEGRGQREIGELWNEYVPNNLLPQLCGYEILMAPYAIAHMKIGLKLLETGYLFGREVNVPVYLTNALDPPEDYSDRLAFAVPALAQEAVSVNETKRSRIFTVVVGNPPYSAHSANLSAGHRKMVDPYRSVNGVPIRERSMLQFEKNLQDDYVKFLALAQEVLTSPLSVCAYITNHSFLDAPTLRGLRWNLFTAFSQCRFLDLHGNANKSEVPPENSANDNVFDIRQGVAISILTRTQRTDPPSTRHADLWGNRAEKYQLLSEHSMKEMAFQEINPSEPYFYFVPEEQDDLSDLWTIAPAVTDVFLKRSTGTESGFDALLVAFDEGELERNVRNFTRADVSDDEVAHDWGIGGGHAREVLRKRSNILSDMRGHFGSLQLRAYDYRTALLRKDLLKTNSFNVMLDLAQDSPGLATTRQTKEPFAAFAVSGFCGHKCISSYDRTYVFPVVSQDRNALLDAPRSNVSAEVHAHFQRVLPPGARSAHIDDLDVPLQVFSYSLAVLNAPSYAERFGSRLKRDWPRIPLSDDGELVQSLVLLGQQLAAFQQLEFQTPETQLAAPVGTKPFLVEEVFRAGTSVWIDKARTKGFGGIPNPVWDYQIGGRNVCEKWLKDRLPKGGNSPRLGRVLEVQDIEHFQRIALAIEGTLRIAEGIDEIIEKHGGWPDAFTA